MNVVSTQIFAISKFLFISTHAFFLIPASPQFQEKDAAPIWKSPAAFWQAKSPIRELLLSPCGTIAVTVHNQHIQFWNVAKRSCYCRTSLPSDKVTSFSFSSDSRILALGDYSGNLVLYQTKDGKRLRTSILPRLSLYHLNLTPQGNTIYCAAYDRFTQKHGIYQIDIRKENPTVSLLLHWTDKIACLSGLAHRNWTVS